MSGARQSGGLPLFGAAGLLWFRAGVLWRSRGGKDAMAQEFAAGAAEYLPLDGSVLHGGGW